MPSILNATTTNGLVTSADNSGSLQLQTNNGTTAVTVTTGQNVGIGTSSPNARLEVSDNLGTFSATGNSLAILNNSNATGQSPLDWRINGTLRGRVRADYVGNMNYVANGGNHFFLINGDSGVGSVGMNIDSTGRVATPFQTAFQAYGNQGTVTVSAGALVPFNTTNLNRGSSYNTSTYLFTAPVTGAYYFMTSIYVQGAVSICFRVNGSEYGSPTPLVFVPSSDQFDQSVSMSFVVQLSANDTVGVQSRGTQSSVIYTLHSNFVGYLIG